MAAISIHAPARGATPNTTAFAKGDIISIHAPARGATHDKPHITTYNLISIHAPARGATITAVSVGIDVNNFNPRPREGGDQPG